MLLLGPLVSLEAYFARSQRALVISAERLTFATCPNGKVLVNLDWPSEKLGLPPDIHLALEFTSAEAWSVARALLRNADEAEAPKSVASPFLGAAESTRWPETAFRRAGITGS
jgi:hypothetical protein